MPTKYTICLAFTIGCLVACTDSSPEETIAPKPPNIILMLADDLGYNDLSCYRAHHPVEGEKPPTAKTPNLDGLAAAGMRFTDFYAGAAVCSPSRSALLTGRNASRVGIYNWIPHNSPMHLRAEEVTIAEMLKAHGYQTAHVGKWHLTSKNTDQPHPQDQGFDHAFYAYNNANPSHKNPENYYRNGQPMGQMTGYACQIVVDEALSWLQDSIDNREPFYLNLWFNEPHLRVEAPEELKARHAYNEAYYGCIENMDLAVGRLLAYLEEQDLAGETIVLFTSDNGSRWDQSNDPLRGEKCFNYEGGIRVPFIIRWPGRVPAGVTSPAVGSFPDVLPSIAALTEAVLPDRNLDGIDLSSVFLGETAAFERSAPIFFYRYFHDPVCMLREGDWCLLGYEELIPPAETLNEGALARIKPGPGEPRGSQWSFQEGHMIYLKDQEPGLFELYNLAEDRAQNHNLADQHPERLEVMKSKMLDLRREMIAEGGNWFAQQ